MCRGPYQAIYLGDDLNAGQATRATDRALAALHLDDDYVQIPLADLVALRDTRIKSRRGEGDGFSYSAIEKVLSHIPQPPPGTTCDECGAHWPEVVFDLTEHKVRWCRGPNIAFWRAQRSASRPEGGTDA